MEKKTPLLGVKLTGGLEEEMTSWAGLPAAGRGLACGRIMAKEWSDGDNGAGTAGEEVLQRANAGTDGGVLYSSNQTGYRRSKASGGMEGMETRERGDDPRMG